MKAMNIIDLLDNETLFTKNELEIVHYIKENPQAVILMTIKELAQVTFSSNASIIRLFRKLGYKGFRDFKIDFMRYMESLKYVRQDIDFSFPFQSDEPTWQIINSLAHVYKESIDLINSQLDIDELEKIVDLLDRSQRVFIYATGDSKITAMGFTNKLIKIGKFFYIATENKEEVSFSKAATTQDVALFITYSKQDVYRESLRILLYNHVPIITITSNHDDILFKYSHYHILIPHKEKNEKIATFYSQISFQYVLSILYSLLYKKQKKSIDNRQS